MRIMRTLVTVVVLGTLVYVGTTIQFGDRTLFGHFAKIWASEETQNMVKGVKEKSAPILERVKRGVEAGVNEANKTHPPAEAPHQMRAELDEDPGPGKPQ